MSLEEQTDKIENFAQPPLISVVIPCHNHGQFLKEAVDSILHQTYPCTEIIIVNDGSTDNTETVAKDIVKRVPSVKFINLPENKGKWFALNTAIEQSTGLIVTSQDADDISLPDRIQRQFDAMRATESVHNLCGFYHCHSEQDVEKYKLERVSGDLKGIEPDVVSQMVEYGFKTEGINHYFTAEFETAGVTAMFLKSVWTLGIRFNPPGMGLRIAASEDSDFNTKCTLLLRNTSVLAEQLYCYRRWSGHRLESK